jgi:hypothetical protein
MASAGDDAMTDIGDTQFHKGDPVWVVSEGGSLEPAAYVGEGETSAWFGGPPTVFVIFTGTDSLATVEVDRVLPRHDED